MTPARQLTALVCVLGLAACTTNDPYTGEEKTSNAAKGAGIGAVAGAVIGAVASDDKGEGALKGAVIGAAAGGGVGYYMDRQEAELREALEGTGVRVRREGDNIRLIMPGNITFATDRAEVKGDFYAVLDSVVQVLKKFKDNNLQIAGHTDATGSDSYNLKLSQQRADSVATYLRSRGVDAGRIASIGVGEQYPIASNASEAGRQQNRRVELQLFAPESVSE